MQNLAILLLTLWEYVKEMAWQTVFVIPAVLLCRFFVGKISKAFSYALWLIVAVRLLCPVMLSSGISIFNWVEKDTFLEHMQVSEAAVRIFDLAENGTGLEAIEAETEGKESLQSRKRSDLQNVSPQAFWEKEAEAGFDGNRMEEESTGTDVRKDTRSADSLPVTENQPENLLPVAENEPESLATVTEASGDTAENSEYLLNLDLIIKKNMIEMTAWLAGMLLMLGYGIFSYAKLKRRLRFATKAEEVVFESSFIRTPFVFGILKPVIYLPYRLTEEETYYLLMHERYHIKRKDYLVKIFAFLLLSVYWFHPLVWISYYLMNRDMEMSCDAYVLKDMDFQARKAYSTLLLNFSAGKRFPLPSPTAFGENDAKSRIRQILHYKKPALGIVIAAVVLMLLVTFFCLTDAKRDGRMKEDVPDTEKAIDTEEAIDMEDDSGVFGIPPTEFAEALYENKNPYIGNAPKNAALLQLIAEQLGIKADYATELQTAEEPYWITLDFYSHRPDEESMWKAGCIFLALTENCSEFHWTYSDNSGISESFYISREDAQEQLSCDSIGAYSESPEKLQELFILLGVKTEDISAEAVEKMEENAKEYTGAKESNWEEAVRNCNLPFYEQSAWENRFIRDGISFRGDFHVDDCYYWDFDNSGTMDLALLTSDNQETQMLYLYLNEEEVYAQEIGQVICFESILTGDVDHDGCMELIYSCLNGGNGGPGGHTNGILKFKDHTFEEMQFPADDTQEAMEESGETGCHLIVTYAEGEGNYMISCPAAGMEQLVHSVAAVYEDGTPVERYKAAGKEAGANCRGYYGFSIFQEDGKDYLMAREYCHGEGGINAGVAEAYLMFDWDADGNGFIRDFTAVGFLEAGSNEIFQSMKDELAYYPSDLDAILAMKAIPVINVDEIISDDYDRLGAFAENVSGNASGDSLIFVRQTEAHTPVYISIRYENHLFYYLEDYTKAGDGYFEPYIEKTFSNCFYETWQRNAHSDAWNYFYLTSAAGITLNDINEHLLSSQYQPDFPETALIFYKKAEKE